MNSTLKEVLNDEGFRAALVAGLVLAVSTWLVARRGRPTPGYAFVAVVATLIGFRAGHRLPASLVVGLVLLVAGEWLSGRRGSWLLPQIVMMVPGALVLAGSLPDGITSGLRVTVAVATVVAAPLVVVTAARDPRLVAALFAVSAVGVFVCVPDTEHAKAMMGGLLAAGLLAADAELAVTPGVSALTGVFVWTAAVGGHGRTGAVVGGIACLGVLVLVPLAGWGRAGRGRTGRGHRWVLLVTQVAYVAFVARVAGFRQTVWAAAALAAPATLIAWVVVTITARRDRPPR